MANSVDPDRTRSSLIWVYTVDPKSWGHYGMYSEVTVIIQSLVKLFGYISWFWYFVVHTSCFVTKPTNWRVPSKDSDQPGHLPNLISPCCPHEKTWVLSYPLSAQRRLWSDWADAQAELSLRWAHSNFVSCVMRRPIQVLSWCGQQIIWNGC